MNIIKKEWPWPNGLINRSLTQYVVVHHTAGPQMQDVDRIWDEHINADYNGIGYHRVIKGDGTIVQGRPDGVIGAHALGVNSCSVGISLEGNFQDGDTPTDAQIAALKWCLADYKAMYPDAQIIGHRDVAGIADRSDYATACPGDTLYNMLPDLQP